MISKASARIEKHRKKVRYLISGGVSFIGEYGFFIFIVSFLPLVASNVISFLVGLFMSFLLHKLWTFSEDEHHHDTHVQFIAYALLAGINIILTSLLLLGMVELLGIESWIAKFISMVAMVSWNYVILNLHIFKPKSE